MAQKPVRILYQAKNNTTGLTDVKAQVYLNGSPKAVGVSAIVLTELDATNSPGLYELFIAGATLTTWGVSASQYNALEGYIDSASHAAKAPFREELTVANEDDVNAHLTSQDTAIAAIQTDTTAIRADLETASSSLPNILAAVQAIQNGSGFAIPVPAQLEIPSSGSNTYRIPVLFYNSSNSLIDPDSNAVSVVLVNQAGTDRGSYMTGYVSGSPGHAPMVRESTGKYHIDLAIPSTAVDAEELRFDFSYAIGGNATARQATTILLQDVAASGYALQSTLLSTQTTVNAIDAIVADGTYGNAAIQTAVAAIQSDITNNVEGTGFTAGNDSLHAISTYLTSNLFAGGRCV